MKAKAIILCSLLLVGAAVAEAAIPAVSSVTTPTGPCDGVRLHDVVQAEDGVIVVLSGPDEQVARCTTHVQAAIQKLREILALEEW